MSSEKRTRVCVIGAGPSGMSVLYYFAKLGVDSPEVVCYEKSSNWGGQWNYTWRTGTDEYGERVTSGIYRDMWTNLPKEASELAHYTFEQHFGRAIPSYFPASVMLDYLEGYWKSSKSDLSGNIRFNTPVVNVTYQPDTDTFAVEARDVIGRNTSTETFSHVIVAAGIYCLPNVPEFKGFDTFTGRILHSHQFKGGLEFRGKRLLVIGASLSAEDVALQCYKYGVSHVIVSWRSQPLGYKFPSNIEERPLLVEVNGNVVSFKDGSSAEVDVVILCTGYKYDYSFLDASLRMSESFPVTYTEDLYKGMIWLKGGNQKLFYVGTLLLVTALPLADAQAAWIVKYITGRNPLRISEHEAGSLRATAGEIQLYLDGVRQEVAKIKDVTSLLEYRKSFVQDIADDIGYKIDVGTITDFLIKCLADREEHPLDFKDFQFTSAYTGNRAESPETKWIQHKNVKNNTT